MGESAMVLYDGRFRYLLGAKSEGGERYVGSMMPPEPPAVLSAPPTGRVLVLVPHADDESLGCGGAIALHRRQGDRVKVVIVTDGAAGDGLEYYAGQDYPALRREEGRRAGAILGVSDLEHWDYSDGKLAPTPKLVDRIATLLTTEQPDTLYRPSINEIHPDHWALGVAVEAVLRQYILPIRDWCYEIWATVHPSHILDITPVWDLKCRAITQYKSQLRYNDYLRMVTGLNAYRTIHLPSARYVEAFQARKTA